MRQPPCGGEPTQHERTSTTGCGIGIGAWMRTGSEPAGMPCTRPPPVGATTERPRRMARICRPPWRHGHSACKHHAPGPQWSDAVPFPRHTGQQGHEAYRRSQIHWGTWPVRRGGRPSLRRMFWRAVPASDPDAGRWMRSEPAPALGHTADRGLGWTPISQASAPRWTTPGWWTGGVDVALIGPC